jgi:UDP-N-acetylmuramoyl-tripeptide--D-alanyl-D-alanine ligase
MRELGDSAPELHAELADFITANGIDVVYAAGPNMKFLYDALPANVRGAHVADAAAMTPLLEKALQTDDLLLIKGSHGSLMYTVAEALLATMKEEKRHAV